MQGEREMTDVADLNVQRKSRPAIEAVLPCYLDGAMLEAALDFAGSLRADGLKLGWAGVHNAWKAMYKGKPLLYIRLNNQRWNGDQCAKWVVTPYLMNLGAYEEDIVAAGWQDLVLDGLWRCKVAVNQAHCGHGCAPGVDRTMLGKSTGNLCNGNFYGGRNWVWFYEPDETAIRCIGALLALEKRARAEKPGKSPG